MNPMFSAKCVLNQKIKDSIIQRQFEEENIVKNITMAYSKDGL